MMPHAAPILCCCCENESICELPRTPDTLISEEVKAPIPKAVADDHTCMLCDNFFFSGTSVTGTNVLVYSAYQYYLCKQIPTNSVSLRCLSIPTLVRPLPRVITTLQLALCQNRALCWWGCWVLIVYNMRMIIHSLVCIVSKRHLIIRVHCPTLHIYITIYHEL